MFSTVFGSVEVMSALILGFATIGAAGLNLMQEARKAKRAAQESASTRGWLRRPLIVMTLALVVAAGGFIYATDSLQASTFARRILPHAGHKLINRQAADRTAQLAPAPKPVVVAPAAGSSARAEAKPVTKQAAGELEDWLQAEGTKIYYRYTKYLPDACPGTPVAIGNWLDGEARPVAARCIDGGWIALDLGPLVQEGRIVPNMTYCMNFRAANGAWGIHVPEHAPGVDSVAVPAVKVPLGRAIGVRYLPGSPREMVLPTADSPRAPC